MRFMEKIDFQMAKWTEFGLEKRISLYELLRSFSQSNLSPQAAFIQLEKSATKNKRPVRLIYRKILSSMRHLRLDKAMREFIPQAELNLIMSGEAAGDLETAFTNAAYIAKAAQQMRSAVTTQFIYAGFLFLAAIGVLVGASKKVVPALENFSGLSPSTQNLVDLSSFLENYSVLVLLALVACIFGISYSLGHWKPNAARGLLERFIPPFSTYRMYQASSFLIVLGALLDGNRSIDASLKDIRANSKPWLQHHLSQMLRSFAAGKEEHIALDTNLLDEEQMVLICALSEAGKLDKELPRIGRTTVERSIKKIQAAGRVINIAMLMLVGGIIAWIYTSIFSSMGQILGNNPLT